MSSFVWFRRVFSPRLAFFVRRRTQWIFPLISRPRRTLPTLAITLPFWLSIRAAEKVEYANETNRPTNIREIVTKLDELFEKEDFQKAYEFIEANKNNPLFESHYVQWRVGRIYFKYSLTLKDKKLKRQLVEQGFEQVKLSLKNGNHLSSVHKWYGILLNAKSEYASSEEQIRCAYEVLDHFEEATRLNPQDPTCHYCLGSWYWEISQISNWKRRLVKIIFGELPRGTVHDALKKFLLAEEISPGFYSKNLLMLIKCYVELNSKPAAMEFAKILLSRPRVTQEDEEVHQELLKLIPRIERLLPFQPQASFSKHV